MPGIRTGFLLSFGEIDREDTMRASPLAQVPNLHEKTLPERECSSNC